MHVAKVIVEFVPVQESGLYERKHTNLKSSFRIGSGFALQSQALCEVRRGPRQTFVIVLLVTWCRDAGACWLN